MSPFKPVIVKQRALYNMYQPLDLYLPCLLWRSKHSVHTSNTPAWYLIKMLSYTWPHSLCDIILLARDEDREAGGVWSIVVKRYLQCMLYNLARWGFVFFKSKNAPSNFFQTFNNNLLHLFLWICQKCNYRKIIRSGNLHHSVDCTVLTDLIKVSLASAVQG